MELHRVTGILDLNRVKEQKVLFLGLGSLGSLAIANLAFPFKKILLADPDLLEPENIERHLLGLSDVGKPKVEGVKNWLLNRGIPESSIEAYHGYAQDVLDDHKDADIAFVSIDKRRVRDDINAWCHENNIPALYGGVYPMGTGGQVMAVLSPRDACYQCAEYVMGGVYEEPPAHVDYGIDVTQIVDHDLHGVPALRSSVSGIADDMGNMGLAFLKGEQIEPQIQLHAFHEWESALVLTNPKLVTGVNQFIELLRSLRLVPNMQMCMPQDGVYDLQIRQGVLSLILQRWKVCPVHTSHVDMSDI